MYDPVMRVFAVLEILQARDHVTGAELAHALEVDLRTVQRYIVRLKDLGIPVDSSPGVGGAYRLRAGYRLPPLLLTNEEAFALSLGLQSLRSIGLEAFAPATGSAVAKLRRVMPTALRESVRTVEDVVAIEPGPWVVPTPVESLIRAVTGIRTLHTVRFAYRSYHKTDSQREIEPFAVMHADGRWYLVGHCLQRKAMRTFRLDRVQDLTVTAKTFVPPSEFDPRAYFAEHMPYTQSQHQIDVWIDLPAEEAGSHFALWRVAMEPDSGGTRLRCGRDNLEFFAAILLGIGRRIVVHNPPELRMVFQQLAQRAHEASTLHA